MSAKRVALSFVVSFALSAAAQADVDLTVLGTPYSAPSTLSITDSGVSHAGTTGTLGAAGDRTTPGLTSSVSGQTSGFFTWGVLGSESVVTSTYQAFGLAPGAMVDFTWKFGGSRTEAVDNATVSMGAGVRIFNKSGPVGIYIHNMGWSISYVDGPAFMGEFAGTGTALWGVPPGGAAGNPANFSAVGPAAAWDGRSTVTVITSYHLETGSSGDLTVSTGHSLAGDVAQSTLFGTLQSATVASASMLTGPAYLLLDNGVQIPISAVPEPSPAMLWAAGALLLAFVARGRRRA